MTDARPDIFDPNCDSREVLALLADRWSMLILYALAGGTLRHGELKAKVGGISQKMLTQTLRTLERNGLVARQAFTANPPHVEYSLTQLGRTLLQPLRAICLWAQDHLPEVRAARASRAQGDAFLS